MPRSILHQGLLWFALTIAPTSVLAGEPAAHGQNVSGTRVFSSLSLPGGAAFNRVFSVTQDPLGMMWLGTEAGLILFDGYDVRVYRHDPDDPNSLAGNAIASVLVDDRGVLWVGVENFGLHRFDRELGTWSRMGRRDGDGVADTTVYEIYQDRSGTLWFGGDGGLGRIQDGRPVTVSEIPVYALAQDSQGALWAGTEYGLARWHPGRNLLEIDRRASLDQDQEEGAEAWRLLIDDGDRMWFAGTGLGLRRFDPASGELKVWMHQQGDPGGIGVNDVYALLFAEDGDLWVGTYDGLALFDVETETFQRFPARPNVPGAIGHPYIADLYRDAQGTLWVATFGGLNLMRGGERGYRYFAHDPENPGSLSGARVQAVTVARDGWVWVGTYDAGLDRLDPRSGRVERFPELSQTPDRQPRRLWQIAEDGAGRTWVVSSQGVMVRLAPDQPFKTLAEAYPDLPSLDVSDIWAVEIGPDGQAWFGSFGAGVYRLDPEAAELSHFRSGDPAFPGLVDDYVTDLAFDDSGQLLVGTYWSGLLRFDGERFEKLDAVAESAAVYRILPDGRRLWVATRGGGLMLLVDDALRARYTVGDGLPSNFVQALGIDADGHLWVTTDHGLASLDDRRDRFSQVRLFAESSGRNYLHGALDIDAEGRFWLGADDGLLQFDPSIWWNAEAPVPQVRISRLESRNAQFHLALGRPRQALHLDASDNTVSLAFAAPQYFHADLIEYQYRLGGVDANWISAAATRRSVRYSNLSPGAYRFEVRARNPGGGWSDPDIVRFEVQPPLWRSSQAYAGYALLMALLLTGGIQLVRSRVRLRATHHRALMQREERLELALWGSGDWMWDWDVSGQRIYCPQMCAFIGVVGAHGWMSLEAFNGAMDADDLERILTDSRPRLLEKDDLEYEMRIRQEDGGVHWFRVRGRVVDREANGRPRRVAGTCKNIDDQKNAERDLRLSAQVMAHSHDAIAILDLGFRFQDVNRSFEQVTGYRREEILGEHAGLLDSGTYPPGFGEQIRQSLQRKGQWRGEIWERRKSGELFYSDLILSSVSAEGGRVSHYIAVFSDVTRRHQSEEELRYLSNYDTLTELPNRTLLQERLSHALVKARRRISRVVVMLVDLDDFKAINESQGHLAGDQILRQTASRLTGAMREEDTIARLSADEFAILVEGTETEREVSDLAQVVMNAMRAPFPVGDEDLRIEASLGVSVYPDHGNDAEALIQAAQTALSAAKEDNRGRMRIYDGDLRAHALNRIRLADELSRVVERGELELHYQPKVRSDDGAVCGVEALVRWRHAQRGLISPEEFIPLAERRGLIVEIGEWVLHRACQQIMELPGRGLDPVPLAVNVSPRQVEDEQLVSMVRAALAESGMSPEQLQLELTETVILSQAGPAMRILEQLRALSVRLVVDDFGTGYSSLSYLNRLPVDHIKIDKSFVQEVESDRFSRAVITAMVSMADSLGLKVTAEGIERNEQLEFLRGVGCREIQGYLVAPPLPFEDLVDFLARHGATRRAAH